MWETEFSDRLCKLRTQKKVSARDMSLSLGQSPGYINRIENRKALPSMSSFFAICEFLGVTPAEFFNDALDAPVLLREAIAELRRLPGDELAHVTALLRDLNRNRQTCYNRRHWKTTGAFPALSGKRPCCFLLFTICRFSTHGTR